MMGRRSHSITGWALLVAAAGIFIDSWASRSLNANSPEWVISVIAPGGLANGSIGLIPAYLGASVGMIGLVLVMYRTQGIGVALLVGVGVIGKLIFWYSYPARATFGGVGSLFIGTSVLALPSWGRIASPLWVASGVLGIPELVRPGINWGPIASFTLLGAAIAVTGAFVLWGLRANREPTPSVQASAQPA